MPVDLFLRRGGVGGCEDESEYDGGHLVHTVLAKQEMLLCQVNIVARALRVPARRKSWTIGCPLYVRGWAGERVAPASLYVLYWKCTLCVRHGGSAYNQESLDSTMKRVVLLSKVVLTFT